MREAVRKLSVALPGVSEFANVSLEQLRKIEGYYRKPSTGDAATLILKIRVVRSSGSFWRGEKRRGCAKVMAASHESLRDDYE